MFEIWCTGRPDPPWPTASCMSRFRALAEIVAGKRNQQQVLIERGTRMEAGAVGECAAFKVGVSLIWAAQERQMIR
jgi:hypothetical protein